MNDGKVICETDQTSVGFCVIILLLHCGVQKSAAFSVFTTVATTRTTALSVKTLHFVDTVSQFRGSIEFSNKQ